MDFQRPKNGPGREQKSRKVQIGGFDHAARYQSPRRPERSSACRPGGLGVARRPRCVGAPSRDSHSHLGWEGVVSGVGDASDGGEHLELGGFDGGGTACF
jgi:hypothetical protein